MIEKTEDIGANNPMAENIYLGYVFMAVCRACNFNIDDFKGTITEFFNNKMVSKALSKSDLNNPSDMENFQKQMNKISQWTEEHPEYKDETWDFNFDKNPHKDGFYYHFTRCPMEKFAREMAILIYYLCVVELITL